MAHDEQVARAAPQRVADVVAQQRAQAPGTPWVIAARGGRTVTRQQLADAAESWAGAGITGRVGLSTTDPVAFAVLFVSLVAAGATVVPLDPSSPVDARHQLLATAGAGAVVTTSDDEQLAGVDAVVADTATLRPLAPTSAPGIGAARAEGASLLFSSGSTGARKAMRLPEAQLLHVARAVASAHRLGPDDRGLNPLPLFHVNAEVVGLLAPLVSGGSVVLDARFRRTGFWELVDASGATWVNAVPAIIAILAKDTPDPALLRRVRFVRSASAPLAVPVLERFEAATGLPVVETYGMTEAASQITANPLHDRRAGTVGVPVDVELRVLDESGAPAPAGTTGRVQLRGPGVVAAYEHGVGTDRFDARGWLDTGDVGSLDDDGYLTLSGRSDDIINRGGEKIFPREVEEVLRRHTGVAEAVVVGRPDPVLGHVPVAYVIAEPDADPALADELVADCARSLPRAHRPVELHVVEDLPLGPTGKLSRRLVASRFEGAEPA